jgi:hypothetical protein
VPNTALLLRLRAGDGVTADAMGRVQRWVDGVSNTLAAVPPERPAVYYDDGEKGNPPAATAPRLVRDAVHGQAVIRFDGVRDELVLVGPPKVNGLTALSIVQVDATTKLTKPGAEWCQQGIGDPIIETGCSGTYGPPVFWPSYTVPEYSGIIGSVMQEMVGFMYGLGPRDQKFFWVRPKSVGGNLTAAIGVHDGQQNAIYVDGQMVQMHATQEGKDVVLTVGQRLNLGVGRFDRHWGGDFAELMIYGRALGADDRKAVFGYLACAYGLPGG